MLSPGPISSGTAVLRGSMAFRMCPSGVQTSPSAWKPGWPLMKPRSTSTSTRASVVSQSAGTVPVMWNHVVPHGRLHSEPTENGAYSWATASANGTGSPGTSHEVTVSGTRSR